MHNALFNVCSRHRQSSETHIKTCKYLLFVSYLPSLTNPKHAYKPRTLSAPQKPYQTHTEPQHLRHHDANPIPPTFESLSLSELSSETRPGRSKSPRPPSPPPSPAPSRTKCPAPHPHPHPVPMSGSQELRPRRRIPLRRRKRPETLPVPAPARLPNIPADGSRRETPDPQARGVLPKIRIPAPWR